MDSQGSPQQELVEYHPSRIIIHQNEFTNNSSSLWANLSIKDHVPVSHISQNFSMEHMQTLSRLGGVVGLSLAFCTQGCGFDPVPAQISGFSRCRKSTPAMSYDYTACKRCLECLFG
ncbi:hypothetical protein TNCV_2492541 [Trichonephila clavipes]|uniref:Uncharacterized protein n=1 Tax=Trichonephila clavipes TaxID=2585209 RepID=A0A8X6S1Y8_TRICX|nr:hypothetical protein TNCV_2492541 [Trichonephila clavipes]